MDNTRSGTKFVVWIKKLNIYVFLEYGIEMSKDMDTRNIGSFPSENC
jgi:hypothetical protein